jgi:hypothetical protein
MAKNRTILLNKANKVLKLLEYGNIELLINHDYIEINIPGITIIGEEFEPIIQHFIKDKVCWNLEFGNDSIKLTIWK